ncbi:MAG: hypothetical protein A3K83_03665 [Omnitrophica WOR_2 bacterium RBG_13_44_8b]|nr:MAG: hypothetical protein A3K83_03665 [Omnitrophica WOR_2 bacterium RBG_13_44_8b]
MQVPFEEKRVCPRFPVSISVTCYIPDLDKTVNTYTRDISAIGIGLVVNEVLPVGTCLDLCLQMPDNGERIMRKAKVVWSNAMGLDSYRVGIKLQEASIKPIPLILRTINYQRKY